VGEGRYGVEVRRHKDIKGVARRAASRPLVLGIVLVTAVLILVVRWAIGRNAAREDALHGDGDEALGALASEMRRMPSTSRLPYLLQSIRDSHPGLRYAAVDALGQYHTPESAAAIEQAFQDSASTVRQRAAETLHTVDRERGFLLLLAASRDEDTWIRQTAVTQLAMRIKSKGEQAGSTIPGTDNPKPKLDTPQRTTFVADRRAVPMLIRALDDADEAVNQQAVGLLHRITGRGAIYRIAGGSVGKQRVIAEWKAWWAASATQYSVSSEFADVQPIRPSRSDPAPDFSLRDIDGRSIRLSTQRGRVTLLNFWGTWCPPCRREVPDIEQVHQKFGASGLDVIGVAVGESNGDAGLRTWCAQNGITYRQALSTPKIQVAYGDIQEVPVSVLIDKQGRIRYRWEGDRDFSTFQAAVTRLLSE
jgi:peroxiredoxin